MLNNETSIEQFALIVEHVFGYTVCANRSSFTSIKIWNSQYVTVVSFIVLMTPKSLYDRS